MQKNPKKKQLSLWLQRIRGADRLPVVYRLEIAQSAVVTGEAGEKARFKDASAYSGDVCALPVKSAEAAAKWYAAHFSMVQIERFDSPVKTVVLERDGVRLGFAENGGDSSQTGAAISVKNIEEIRAELQANGLSVANSRVDERDGEKFNVFFVVAPDGLCFYFNEPL